MELSSARDGEGTKWFHISTKGIDRSLFKSPKDFQQALNIIAVAAFKFDLVIYAYCLMSNHIHTAVKTLSEPVANQFINYFKWRYSQYFQLTYGKEVLDTDSGIFDRVSVSVKELKTEQSLRNCIAYILRNPVEARICTNADQYPWSS